MPYIVIKNRFAELAYEFYSIDTAETYLRVLKLLQLDARIVDSLDGVKLGNYTDVLLRMNSIIDHHCGNQKYLCKQSRLPDRRKRDMQRRLDQTMEAARQLYLELFYVGF